MIQASADFDGTERPPMRLAEARVTLGVVAARQGDLEHAVHYGEQALSAPRSLVMAMIMETPGPGGASTNLGSLLTLLVPEAHTRRHLFGWGDHAHSRLACVHAHDRVKYGARGRAGGSCPGRGVGRWLPGRSAHRGERPIRGGGHVAHRRVGGRAALRRHRIPDAGRALERHGLEDGSEPQPGWSRQPGQLLRGGRDIRHRRLGGRGLLPRHGLPGSG